MVRIVMDASKLTIDPNKLRFEKMSAGKRAELRRRNIIALVRNTPAGEIITLSQFLAVTQSTMAGTHGLIKSMVKNGLLIKTQSEDKPKHHSYSLPPTSIRSIAEPVVETTVPTPRVHTEHATLEAKAQEFAWKENSDSLRGFVAWMDGQELDLRRMLDGGGY